MNFMKVDFPDPGFPDNQKVPLPCLSHSKRLGLCSPPESVVLFIVASCSPGLGFVLKTHWNDFLWAGKWRYVSRSCFQTRGSR